MLPIFYARLLQFTQCRGKSERERAVCHRNHSRHHHPLVFFFSFTPPLFVLSFFHSSEVAAAESDKSSSLKEIDMEFVVIQLNAQGSPPRVIPFYSLVVAATRETQERANGRTVGATTLRISGSAVVRVCLRELQRDASDSARAALSQLSALSFTAVLVDYNSGPPGETLQLVPMNELADHWFDVEEDLLQPNRLLVLTQRDALAGLAVDPERLGSLAREAVIEETPKQQQQSGRNARLSEGVSAGSSVRRRSKQTRKVARLESSFRTVPNALRLDDVTEMNDLMDSGVLPVTGDLKSFVCERCKRLPPVTLTMWCCGAVICGRCAPTPPAVQGAPLADRLCPVCGEEPLEAPEPHPKRDEEVAHLVKELKVLYFPQLQQQRNRPSQRSTPALLPSARHTPVLQSVPDRSWTPNSA